MFQRPWVGEPTELLVRSLAVVARVEGFRSIEVTTMVEYRRGVAKKRKNELWHWRPECESYPLETFAIRKDKPTEDQLCSRCAACA